MSEPTKPKDPSSPCNYSSWPTFLLAGSSSEDETPQQQQQQQEQEPPVKKVYIGDLGKWELLEGLWTVAHNSPSYKGHPMPTFDRLKLAHWLEHAWPRMGDIEGKIIRSDISQPEADPSGYDQEHGAGAFQRVADDVRRQKEEARRAEEEARAEEKASGRF
ncbi:hypothetical protein BJX76DRAFT_359594 [Aspergillus varians]